MSDGSRANGLDLLSVVVPLLDKSQAERLDCPVAEDTRTADTVRFRLGRTPLGSTLMDDRRAIHRHRGAMALALVLLGGFHVVLADTYHLPLLPSASDPLREGMVRIVNHSADAGDVAITAIDDAGYVYGPVTLTVAGQAAVHLSSADLQQGNATKGLSGGVGAGQGDWRLMLNTTLDIEPSAYVQTTSGFVDRIHDLLPPTWFYHRVALVGPDSGGQHDGQLRLINPADTEAQVVIFGLDDEGNTVPGQVALTLAAGTARTVTASELEDGASGLTGQLGEGDGDWQLLVFADPSVEVMTLLDSVSGPLANLSSAVTDPGDMAFFPSSGNASRSGMLRITNRTGAGDIEIHAVDDYGTGYGPITLTLAGAGTTDLSSADLENGNAEKGLPTGLDSGEGDWRLNLESDLDLDVVAYARTPDGFVTAIDDVAAQGDRRHHVPWFNPASETMQTSRLRLINPTDSSAEVVIRAWDDAGDAAPVGAVSLTLAAGASKSVTAQTLEEGAEGLTGNLGDGEGKWRLSVQADRAIRVMSLVESSGGHLTNVSTSSSLPRFLNSCIGGPADADGDGVSDHCDRDPDTALRPLGGCADGTYVVDPDGNPGLVGDCRVLIGFANLQAQSDELPDDHVLRQWGLEEEALISTWNGIVISGGHITEIRMAGTSETPGGLTGFIPPELGQLTELTVLNLSHNALTGPIPPSLGELAKLTQLLLNDNELTGAIPLELGNLANLTRLRLDGNRLSGAIPSELGELVNLAYLYLSRNRLNGPIPPSLGALTELTVLSAFENELTGPIPVELGQLANLTNLYLYNNALSGPIPDELGQLASARDLRLASNQLTGRIPPELGQLANLTYLSLHSNRLSGAIPAELGNLARLVHLRLHGNQLSGPIPGELGQLASLTHLNLYDNALSGAIPSELEQLTSLTHLNLYNNALNGAIPAELGHLASVRVLRLASNQLSGLVPPELGQMANVTNLSLHSNELSGLIPPELGQMANVTNLSLHSNELSGPIPPELGQMANVASLSLHSNELSGSIPAELGNLAKLKDLQLYDNRLTGTVPWAFWERMTRGELSIRFGGNMIRGFEPPPQRSTRPVFSTNAADNGNASHHSVAYYQGPLTWSWNWQDEAVGHQQPVLGRWAVLAVRIDHEVADPPLVITRVLDSDDEVLAERLTEAAPPSTQSTGSGQWRTEYVFELPGSLYQAGNQLVHAIDPDGELAETDEDDNVGEPIVLYGEAPPRFRVTFVPFVHVSDSETPFLDAAGLMAGSRAFWPIADDLEAVVRSPVRSDASGKYELLDELRAIWNAEADADEFYHGVFRAPWSGDGEEGTRGGGVAEQPGRVAMSQISPQDVIPHEFGHNLSLGHTPGCDAGGVDDDYPYAEGALGPNPGWDVNWRRYISSQDEGYADVMSYCRSGSFVSDYHYRKALEYWLSTALDMDASAAPIIIEAGAGSQLGPVSAEQFPADEGQEDQDTDNAGGLALSGRVDASGAWSLTHSQVTEKEPRPPAPDGEFTLILFDASGVELYRETLSVMAFSHGGEAGWAARTPTPARPAREVAILDAQGVLVLRDELPALE